MSRRSPWLATMARMRGSINLYQTAESYWSVKHSASLIACSTTAFSPGSRCPSANADPPLRVRQIAASAAKTRGRRGSARVRRGQPRTYELKRIGSRELQTLRITAVTIFELACFDSTVRDHDPVRNTQKLRVCELYARSRVAVVIQHFYARRGELFVQTVGSFAHAGRLVLIQRHEHHEERSDRVGPDDAALI